MKNLDYIIPIASFPTLVIFGSNPIMIMNVNLVIRITIVPTLGSFGNAISSNDKMPLWFLELMITIQTNRGFYISLSKELMLFSFNYGDKILKRIGVSENICSFELSNCDLKLSLTSWHRFQHNKYEDCLVVSIIRIVFSAWNNTSTPGIKKGKMIRKVSTMTYLNISHSRYFFNLQEIRSRIFMQGMLWIGTSVGIAL